MKEDLGLKTNLNISAINSRINCSISACIAWIFLLRFSSQDQASVDDKIFLNNSLSQVGSVQIFSTAQTNESRNTSHKIRFETICFWQPLRLLSCHNCFRVILPVFVMCVCKELKFSDLDSNIKLTADLWIHELL